MNKHIIKAKIIKKKTTYASGAFFKSSNRHDITEILLKVS